MRNILPNFEQTLQSSAMIAFHDEVSFIDRTKTISNIHILPRRFCPSKATQVLLLITFFKKIRTVEGHLWSISLSIPENSSIYLIQYQRKGYVPKKEFKRKIVRQGCFAEMLI